MAITKPTPDVLNLNKDITVNGITVGRGSGNISTNTTIGSSAFQSNSTGTENTAIGPSSLTANTTGIQNVAIGKSLQKNTAGSQNTAIGHNALSELITGNNNTSIGISSLLQFQGGSFLTAIGSGAMAYFVSGNANTAIGNGAMLGLNAITKQNSDNTAVGDASQLKIDTGSGNSSVGAFSLINNETGNYNSAIGNGALSNIVSYSNSSGVGYNSQVDGSNQVQLGNSSTTTYTYGAVQNRSDKRDKTDIRDTALGLDFIKSLRPVDFKWDMREDYRPAAPTPIGIDATEEEKEKYKKDTEEWIEACKLSNITHDGSKKRSRFHHGLIAQEVKELLEEAGIDFGGFQDHSIKGGDDVLSIGYIELIAPMIKAIQQLSQRVDELESK